MSSITGNPSSEDYTPEHDQSKRNGCIARANTVTTCGKAKAVPESLDVAQCFARLQGELMKDEALERDEAGEEGRQKEHKEEEKRKEMDQAEQIDRVQDHPGVLGPGKSISESRPEIPEAIMGGPRQPSTVPKFDRGIGPAPGEKDHYSAEDSNGGCCVIS